MPSAAPLRAWIFMIWFSWRRQAAASCHGLDCPALLGLTLLIVFLNATPSSQILGGGPYE